MNRPIEMTATARYIGEEGHVKPGQRLFVTERRAGQLEQQGLARRAEPAKKSQSSEPGKGVALPSSPAAQASAPTTSNDAGARDSESSGLTTPTDSAPSTPSTPATESGGTITPKKRGRPPKVRP